MCNFFIAVNKQEDSLSFRKKIKKPSREVLVVVSHRGIKKTLVGIYHDLYLMYS